MKNIFIEIIWTIFLPLLVTHIFINLFLNKKIALNFSDVPNHRKKHRKNIPAFGGIAIFFSIVLSILIIDVSIPYNDILGIFLGAVMILLIGIYDDLYKMNVFCKLVGQIVASILTIVFIQGLHNIELFPFLMQGFGIENMIINIIFMLVVINSVNFLDGLDGLLVSFSLLVLLFFYVCFYKFGVSLYDLNLILIISGSLIGFLIFNKHPAKIFLGDSGSMLIGWMFATLSLYFVKIDFIENSIVLPLIILSIPIIDMFFVVFYRLFNSRGNIYHRMLNIFKSDRNHLHHLLLEKNNSQNLTLLIICLSGIVIILFTLLFLNYKINISIVSFSLIIYLTLAAVRLFLNKKLK